MAWRPLPGRRRISLGVVRRTCGFQAEASSPFLIRRKTSSHWAEETLSVTPE